MTTIRSCLTTNYHLIEIEHNDRLNITSMNWAYIAGFFDGEGCVFQNNKNLSCRHWQVVITQKDRNVLDDIQSFVGYGTIYRENTVHRYKIFRQQEVLNFLCNIFLYLVVKKKKVKDILEHPWKRQTRMPKK